MSTCRTGSVRYAPILLVMALLVFSLGIVPPTTAWASDGEEGTTGFIAGLDTLVNPDSEREIENDPVRDYEYVPVREVVDSAETVYPEEGEEIQYVVSAVNSNPLSSPGNFGTDLLGATRQFLVRDLFRSQFIVPAVGMVFVWWGVRKAKNMIVAAWRAGKASV